MINAIKVTRSGDEYVVSGEFSGTMAELCEAIEAEENENK